MDSQDRIPKKLIWGRWKQKLVRDDVSHLEDQTLVRLRRRQERLAFFRASGE